MNPNTGRIMAGAAGVFLLDQATKDWVLRALPPWAVRPFAPFFSLTHVRNTGAAFGILPGGNILLIVLTAVILAALAFFHGRLAGQGLLNRIGLAGVWGGALGNGVERIFRGSVTDFLDFYWKDWHWPAFNVADSAICVGVFCLALESLLNPEPGEKKT